MDLAAEQIAYQQQIEARRSAHQHLAELDSIAEAPLVDEDTAKACAALEAAWLDATPVLPPPVTRSIFVWSLVLPVLAAGRAFVIRHRWHWRRRYRKAYR